MLVCIDRQSQDSDRTQTELPDPRRDRPVSSTNDTVGPMRRHALLTATNRRTNGTHASLIAHVRIGWPAPRCRRRRQRPAASPACKHRVARTHPAIRPRNSRSQLDRPFAPLRDAPARLCHSALARFTPLHINVASRTTDPSQPDSIASVRPVQLSSRRQPHRPRPSQDSGSYSSKALPRRPSLVHSVTLVPRTNYMLLLRVTVTRAGADIPSRSRIHLW